MQNGVEMKPDLLTVDSNKLSNMSRDDLVKAFEAFSRTSEELVSYFAALETKIAELNKELERSRRLAAIGEVAAMLAHEIRNPLAGMELSLSVLMRQDFEDSQRLLLDNVYKGIKRLDSIVEDILSFAQDISLKKEDVNVCELLRNSISFLKHEIDAKSVSVEMDCKGTMWIASVDKGYMERVFTNIIDNAVAAVDNKGKMWIKLWKTGESLWISFEDSGDGFSEEALCHALEPFFTTKTRGTGLGLAICNRIVSAHRGKILIENSKRGGKVSLCLPLS